VTWNGMVLRSAAAAALLFGLALVFGAAPAGAARCDRADARLAKTGKGDRDGDGLSNCRERMLRTAADDADSDDDGLDDGEEMSEGCDPHDSDSDGDGVPDGVDETPAAPPEQKLEALLDALVCPAEAAAGSLTALGVTLALDETTEFEDAMCEEIAALFATGEDVLVEVKILEDEAGALIALEVELEDGDHDFHHGGGGDDDGDGDDEGDDEGDDD
jgi:hypothetical protein